MRRVDECFGTGAGVISRDQLVLQDVSLGAEEEWTNPPDGLAFVFPRRGAGDCAAGGVSHALGPGGAAILSSKPGSRLRSPHGKPLAFSFFTASIDRLYPLFGGHELQLLQQVEERLDLTRFHVAPTAVARRCHTLLREVPPQSSHEHRGQLMRVAGVLLANEMDHVVVRADGYVSLEEHLKQVWETLSLDQVVSLSVGELASRFGCSRRHLTRLFHQRFGMSAVALRLEVRLLKAASLLRDPSVKVIQVAQRCGFNHLGLFGTCFKNRFGASPREWRKQVLQGASSAPANPANDVPLCNFASAGLCPWRHQGATAPRLLPDLDHHASAAVIRPLPPCKIPGLHAGLVRAAGRG